MGAAPVPPGGIIVWAGSASDALGVVQPVQGWALCNGAAVSSQDPTFSALHAVIGPAFGNGQDRQGYTGAGNPDFNLPDFRGCFLRGVNLRADPRYGDPDAASRGELHDGHDGNRVGSYQADDFVSHNHNIVPNPHAHRYSTRAARQGGAGNEPVASDAGGAVTARTVEDTALSVDNQGGRETRPRNVYVNYLIKL